MTDDGKKTSGADLAKTVDDAIAQGLLNRGDTLTQNFPLLYTEPDKWSVPKPDPRSVEAAIDLGPPRPRPQVDGETNDPGRATTKQEYIDCSSFVEANTSLNIWHEFARFVAPRGKIGIVRLLWTWLDLLGSPAAGATFYGAIQNALTLGPFSVKALGGYSATLPGTALQQYTPLRLLVALTATTPPLVGDCRIRLGTSAGGNEILPDTPLIGLTVLNGNYSIDITGLLPPISGNATLYLTVTTADTGAGTGTARATLYGVLTGQSLIIPVSSGSPCGLDPTSPRRQGINTIRWSLRLEQLAGRGLDPYAVPNGGLGGDPPGFPWPGIRDWNDSRYAWGTPGNLNFLVIPSDHVLKLCAYVPVNVRQFVGWIGGRLQGYLQAESQIAVKNIRHGWQW